MDRLDKFIDTLISFGMEYFRRYYGPYRARVVVNKDPEGLGRILVEVPRALFSGNNARWVLPMMDGAGRTHGVFWPPEENDYVYVFFDNGDPQKPLGYLGGWYAEGEVDEAFRPENDGSPKKRGFRTPGGHLVALSDKAGEETVVIRHKDGTIVKWTADKKIQVGKEGGTFEPMLKGSTVKKWLESHTHSHAWGPTAPPIQPFPVDGLSDDTETS